MLTQTQAIKPAPIGDEGILSDRVHQALFAVQSLRLLHAPIQVTIKGDRVTLKGVVATARLKDLALQAVGQVPGITQVEDRLLTEPDLEIGIAQALAADPRTHGALIRVNATNNKVVLQGRVATPEIVQLAESIAQTIPGVGQILNHLYVG